MGIDEQSAQYGGYNTGSGADSNSLAPLTVEVRIGRTFAAKADGSDDLRTCMFWTFGDIGVEETEQILEASITVRSSRAQTPGAHSGLRVGSMLPDGIWSVNNTVAKPIANGLPRHRMSSFSLRLGIFGDENKIIDYEGAHNTVLQRWGDAAGASPHGGCLTMLQFFTAIGTDTGVDRCRIYMERFGGGTGSPQSFISIDFYEVDSGDLTHETGGTLGTYVGFGQFISASSIPVSGSGSPLDFVFGAGLSFTSGTDYVAVVHITNPDDFDANAGCTLRGETGGSGNLTPLHGNVDEDLGVGDMPSGIPDGWLARPGGMVGAHLPIMHDRNTQSDTPLAEYVGTIRTGADLPTMIADEDVVIGTSGLSPDLALDLDEVVQGWIDHADYTVGDAICLCLDLSDPLRDSGAEMYFHGQLFGAGGAHPTLTLHVGKVDGTIEEVIISASQTPVRRRTLSETVDVEVSAAITPERQRSAASSVVVDISSSGAAVIVNLANVHFDLEITDSNLSIQQAANQIAVIIGDATQILTVQDAFAAIAQVTAQMPIAVAAAMIDLVVTSGDVSEGLPVAFDLCPVVLDMCVALESTRVFGFTLKDPAGVVIPIVVGTPVFVLTGNRNEFPPDATDQVFALTGTVLGDGSAGQFQFSPLITDFDEAGDFFYDVIYTQDDGQEYPVVRGDIKVQQTVAQLN